MSYADVDRVARARPERAAHDARRARSTRAPELARAVRDRRRRCSELVDTAQRLEGVARHASTHAAGVVISREPLVEHVPLQRPTRGDESVDPDDAVRDGAGRRDRPAEDGLPRPLQPDDPRRAPSSIIERTHGVHIDLQNAAGRRPARRSRCCATRRDLRRLPAGVAGHAPRRPGAAARQHGGPGGAGRALPPGPDAAHRHLLPRQARPIAGQVPAPGPRRDPRRDVRRHRLPGPGAADAQKFAGYSLGRRRHHAQGDGQEDRRAHAGRAREVRRRRRSTNGYTPEDARGDLRPHRAVRRLRLQQGALRRPTARSPTRRPT